MRDRLIELLKQGHNLPCGNGYPWEDAFCKGCDYEGNVDCHNFQIADYLLENGVIVQKKINGYEEYFIDEYGNVYSQKSRRYLNQDKGKDGYYYVQLCRNGERKRIAVHRLVATNFIENPNSLPQVNHKDENKLNNNINNLEWCTEKYNTNYGNAIKKRSQQVSKAVVCIETGEVFLSQKSAESKIGKCYKHICDCCKGKKQTCGGYHWRYATREEAEKALEEGGEG